MYGLIFCPAGVIKIIPSLHHMREVADSFRANESMIFVIVRTNHPIIINEKEIVTEKENIILIPNEIKSERFKVAYCFRL